MTGRYGSLRESFARLKELGSFGGWAYRDAHYLAVDLEIDPDRARAFVPRPLSLARPARAQIFVAHFPSTSFGSVYSESGVFFDVRHRLRRAIHCPWMLVDDDVALILGRELLGYPKKLGEITWRHEGDRISASVRRRDRDLLTFDARIAEPIADPPPFLGRPHRNVRTTSGIALPKVIAFTPRERPIEVRRADVQLALAGSERDPLHHMGFGRVLGARLHRVDLGGSFPPLPIGLANPVSFFRQWLVRSH